MRIGSFLVSVKEPKKSYTGASNNEEEEFKVSIGFVSEFMD
jgi:hypothetical protein